MSPSTSTATRRSHRPSQTAPRRRGDIQGMRAVAVLLVVASHAAVPGLAGGYVGVDVFFVVSGFLITGILVRQLATDGRVSALDFYARRARRILPAASVVLLAVTVAAWLSFGYVRAKQVLDDVVWASLFGANVHSALVNSDYFATDTFVSPVQHYWSLSVEEQFYLVWPGLVVVTALLARRRPRRALGVVIGLLCVASFVWCVRRTEADPTTAYFSPTFTRGWELGAGALLAILAPRLQVFTRGFLTLCSWAGLVMIGVAAVRFTSTTAFPGYAALLPVLGTVLVLAGGTRETRYGARLLLDRRPMRWVGDVSYSLYLWHWPVLVIPTMLAGRELGLTRNLALVAGSITLAALSHRFVEAPFRRPGFWHHDRAAALSLWPGAISVVLATVAVVGAQATTGTISRSADRAVLDTQQAATTPDALLAVQHAAARARAGAALPARLAPAPLHVRDDHWILPRSCWAGTNQSRHQLCNLGATDGTRTIALFGDSHMGMLTVPIAAAAKARGWKVIPLVKPGCPPFAVTPWKPKQPADLTACLSWRSWALGRLAALHPDRIVVAGYTQMPLADPHGAGEADPATATRLMATGMARTMTRLRAITPQVSALGDTTKLPEDPVDCFGARHLTLATCAKPLNPLTATRNARWRQASVAAGATYVDTRSWYCASVCPLVVGNVVVYSDEHHLTRTYAATLAPLLARALKL